MLQRCQKMTADGKWIPGVIQGLDTLAISEPFSWYRALLMPLTLYTMVGTGEIDLFLLSSSNLYKQKSLWIRRFRKVNGLKRCIHIYIYYIENIWKYSWKWSNLMKGANCLLFWQSIGVCSQIYGHLNKMFYERLKKLHCASQYFTFWFAGHISI